MTKAEALQKLESSGYTRQLLAAAVAGLEASLAGESHDRNPYSDVRTRGGRVTFSRSFRTAWTRGYQLGRLVHEA